MTRRWWWQHNNNDQEKATMGTDWQGHVAPVRAVPAIDSASHDDFIAQERERAATIVQEDRERLATALGKFSDRFGALDELGGELAGEQQLAEIRELTALWSVVAARADIIRSRSEHRVGLFQIASRFVVVRGTKSLGGWVIWDRILGSYSRRYETRAEAEAALNPEGKGADETCTNGEDQDK